MQPRVQSDPTMSSVTEVRLRNKDNLATQSSLASVAMRQDDILIQILLPLSEHRETVRIPSTNGRRIQWDWVCVTEVCRHWHQVSTQTPILWTHLQTFDKSKRTKKYLLLSRNYDLRVVYRDSDQNRTDGLRNLTMVLKEMRRIRQLDITINGYRPELESIYRLLESPATRMESMTLNLTRNRVGSKPSIQLPFSSCNRLKRVLLSSVDLFECDFRLHGLSFLRIAFCDNVNLSELLKVLEASPELAILSLEGCQCYYDQRLPDYEIHLPHLLSLSLNLDQFFIIFELIKHMDVQNLLRLMLVCGHTEDKELMISDVAKLDIISKLLRREYGFKSMELSTDINPIHDGAEIKMTINPDMKNPNSGQVFLAIGFDHLVDLDIALIHLMEAFKNPLSRVEVLTMNFPYNLITVDTWHSFFRAIPSVRSLYAKVGFKGDKYRTDFLEALVGPQNPLDYDGVLLPCPNLELLSVAVCDQGSNSKELMSALKETLEERSTYGLPVRLQIKHERPDASLYDY